MDHRKTEMYRRIVALGGWVPDQATWRAIGQLCGYTVRSDLAGFFGGREPSMVRLADGTRVLTAAGRGRAAGLGV